MMRVFQEAKWMGSTNLITVMSELSLNASKLLCSFSRWFSKLLRFGSTFCVSTAYKLDLGQIS